MTIRQTRLHVVQNPEASPAKQTAAAATLQWIDEALCGNADDPDVFFPPNGARTDLLSPAKDRCGACTVANDCLEFALDTRQKFGIWGGKTRHERRAIAAARRTGDGVSPAEAQDWLRAVDDFAVDAMAAALAKAASDGLMPDYRALAREALAHCADMLDEADTG